MAGAKSAGYKLATYKSSDGPRAGIIIGNDVFDAAKLTGKAGYATVMGILADWKAAEPALKKAAAGAAKSRAKRQPLSKTKLLAPLRFPSAIYCAGANYSDHAAEMAAKEGNPPPVDPHTLGHKAWHFLKAAGASSSPIRAQRCRFPTMPKTWTGRSRWPPSSARRGRTSRRPRR